MEDIKIARIGIGTIRTFKNGKREDPILTLFRTKQMIDLLRNQGYKIKFVA